MHSETATSVITGLTADSRRVQSGYLFAALPGASADGRAFIADAVARGAIAVLAPPGTRLPAEADDGRTPPVALIEDDNPRRRFALLAARYFGKQPDTVCAVTGTNGKTSVVWFLRQIWEMLGYPAASLGTLGVHGHGINRPGSLTTPDPASLHETLAALASSGVQRLAMEASSHGLDQCRLDGVRIAAGAFTNLTRDHLDYHRTMEAYRTAKLRLFSELIVPGGAAVLCADDPQSAMFVAAADARSLRVLTYGFAGRDVQLLHSRPEPGGQTLNLRISGSVAEIPLPLAGDFQALNALAAAGLAIATGARATDVIGCLDLLRPVPGRLELVADVAGAVAYVDYAHTPDALGVVLRALRRQTTGRLFVVFGCGGDRDPGKRTEMGLIAGTLADRVIVTDDNPRSEDAAAIRAAVLTGCPAADEIGDRSEAIDTAVRLLRPGDILLVAGKGHETGQIIGSKVLPFDDATVVRAACARRSA